MKHIFLILILLATLSCCKNDDDNNDTLPPATQTGAGIFACYVNGTSYIDTSGGYFNCFYQFIDGEYFFGIGGEDNNHNLFDQIILASNASSIEEGIVYTLTCNLTDSYYGEVAFTGQLLDATTCNTNFGTMTITKLDFTNNIISGTFEFDIIHPNTGETIQIREGRFDTLFTQ
ncbi:MAG: hypothetical protein ACK5M1_07435 [Xanthomarina gelatinilytica]|uniref:hypothetical protein n=1 Tax=Xanthomarina gelatinilytica TaxID=1137281 RepID=UPI003A8A899F